MGSLAVQPPSGVTRNLTEVFIFLRNNARQSQIIISEPERNDDKMELIASNCDRTVIYSDNRNPPTWVNVTDEIHYEFTRIRSRITLLKELQHKQFSRPDLAEEQTTQQIKINELTDEITTMFGHSRRLIRLLEDEKDQQNTSNIIRRNVISSQLLLLNSLMNEFRMSQSNYLRHLDSKHNLDSFLIKSLHKFDLVSDVQFDEEMSIEQIQHIIENEHMTKEREKEILQISRSIIELNTIFKDINTMIVDQGAILDRIDYNCEESASRIKSALKSVEKAEKYQQKNKKMHLIVVLAGFAIFLMFLIILKKF